MSLEIAAKVAKQTVTRKDGGGGFVVERKLTGGTVKEEISAAGRRKRQKGAEDTVVPAATLRQMEKDYKAKVRAVNQKANEACDMLKRRIAELEGKRARPKAAARDGVSID